MPPVQVSQPKAGRVRVRGLRVDPLTVPLAHSGSWPAHFPGRLALGVDEWGNHRSLPLGRNVTGILVSGLPGYGKTVSSTAGSATSQARPRLSS